MSAMAGRPKHLLALFTLLALLSPAAAFVDSDQLEEMLGNIHKLQREAERRQADHMLDRTFISDLFGELSHIMDPLIKLVDDEMPDFPPISKLMRDLKNFIDSSKVYIEKDLQKNDAKLSDNTAKLRELEQLILNLTAPGSDL